MAILGFALTEAIALFALMIVFLFLSLYKEKSYKLRIIKRVRSSEGRALDF